uniref:Phosphatidylinositol-glycan biosynthesis class F protein n=1 Tax=Panagrolaimus sp. JU765 TaxID=591449 RepID=A0AC34QGL2_9BILA
MSLLTTLPMCFVTSADSSAITELVFEWNPTTKAQFYVLRSTIGTILGAWLGAFVIPLDWDRWWQVWPLPCLFGCSVGFIFGLLEAYIEFRRSPTKRLKFAPKHKAF